MKSVAYFPIKIKIIKRKEQKFIRIRAASSSSDVGL